MNKEHNILSERARKIAGKKGPENQSGEETISVVEFLLTPERYAFEEKYVSEVLFLRDITSVPGTPLFVMGVINLRGRILSIINFKRLFNLKERGLTELNKVIVLRNDNMEFGVIADSITGNKSILLNTLSKPQLTFENNGAGYISGVTPDGLILLNAMSLLSSKQIIIAKQK